MLIQEEHEQSVKLTVSLHGGKTPSAQLRKARWRFLWSKQQTVCRVTAELLFETEFWYVCPLKPGLNVWDICRRPRRSCRRRPCGRCASGWSRPSRSTTTARTCGCGVRVRVRVQGRVRVRLKGYAKLALEKWALIKDNVYAEQTNRVASCEAVKAQWSILGSSNAFAVLGSQFLSHVQFHLTF